LARFASASENYAIWKCWSVTACGRRISSARACYRELAAFAAQEAA
jgi:hypothetical protein